MSSVIAIVGRPNVGKSTLFNKLTYSNAALVADFSGLTRDRQYGLAKDSSVVLVDTGGLNTNTSDLSMLIKNQTESAIQGADILFFMVDVKDGLVSLDLEIAKNLRANNKPIFLVINKVDGLKEESALEEFQALGFKETFSISCAHNKRINLISEFIESLNDETNPIAVENSSNTRISIVGRPNAGKSTLINRLVGKERVLVSPEAGTTRDSIEIPLNNVGHSITLIDTAGIRRKRSITTETEKYIVSQSLGSIKRSNLVILLIDSTELIVDQDLHLLGLSLALGRPVIIGANKVDLLTARDRKKLIENISLKLRFADFINIHLLSAKEGEGVDTLLGISQKIFNSSIKNLETPLLNKILREAIRHQPPSLSGRFRPKLRYIHSGGKNPPSLVIHGTNLKKLTKSYKKYLTNFFYDRLNLESSPIRLKFSETENPFKDKKNILNERQRKRRKKLIKKR